MMIKFNNKKRIIIYRMWISKQKNKKILNSKK